MSIKIIGWGCTKTNRTLANANAAVSEFDERPRIHWINDIHDIVTLGGFAIPTVVVNEKVKASGRIPSVYEFAQWIEEELEAEEIAA